MTGALRQAKLRRRRRLGLVQFTVELPELRVIDKLVQLRVLPADRSDDPAAITRALEIVIARKIL